MSDGLETPSPRRLAVTLLLAAAGAAAILVTVVLPAEYQIDPTGLGRWIGLDRLAATASGPGGLQRATPGTATSRSAPFRSEQLTIELAAAEEMELKLAMDQGDTVVFSWQVEGGVVYSDFHAEPYGEPEGGAIRYQESEAAGSGHGALTAPFAGHHGWYWVNGNDSPVRIALQVSGWYRVLKERRSGR